MSTPSLKDLEAQYAHLGAEALEAARSFYQAGRQSAINEAATYDEHRTAVYEGGAFSIWDDEDVTHKVCKFLSERLPGVEHEAIEEMVFNEDVQPAEVKQALDVISAQVRAAFVGFFSNSSDPDEYVDYELEGSELTEARVEHMATLSQHLQQG